MREMLIKSDGYKRSSSETKKGLIKWTRILEDFKWLKDLLK